jgi:aryl-alcohol dehydrogenase-like predicted oxidoreductase
MKISKLQLGTVQFGLDYGVANKSGKPSYETARDTVNAAYNGGIRCFDTAAVYGNSEEVLGRSIAELNLEDRLIIVTKISPVKGKVKNDSDAEKFIFENIESSLEKLRLNKLQICLFHREDDIDFMPLLIKARNKGLVEKIGISIDSKSFLEEVLNSGAEYVQAPFNILDKRMLESGFFEKASRKGLKIFVRSVYLQGLLFIPESNISADLAPVIPVRRKLCAIAEEAEMTMAELCMRYVLSFPEIASVLTGVDSVGQLEENLKLAGKGPLDETLLEEIKKTVPLFSEKILRPSLWNRL